MHPPARLFRCCLAASLLIAAPLLAQTQLDYPPGRVLADDIAQMDFQLAPDYATQHPRLLFFEKDRAALQQRAKDEPELWRAVIAHANGIKHNPPDEARIRKGDKYWRAEYMQSGALAWFVTGDAAYRDGTIAWMKAFCAVDVWGTGFRDNVDLQAAWYLYHISIAYDILYDEIPAHDRTAIEQGIIDHAEALYAVHAGDEGHKIRYDQNHTYIPTTALTAAALTLYGRVDAAKKWLNQSAAILRRSRYVQSEDGYYYEGFGYYVYALHWQVRAAELLSRATDENYFELPVLRDTWMNALYLSLPGDAGAYDIGDCFSWSKTGERNGLSVNNHTMMWAIASANGSPENQTAGNFYQARKPDLDYPAAAFLWFDPAIEPAPFDTIPPYHYFPDHDIVSWRSGWDDDATCVLFRCGPPLGHAAMDKLGELDDWIMNCGHVHPDIGAFWLYAKGQYLALDTGYLARKWTEDHNTLLIDGKGQGIDGSYWNDRGADYGIFDRAHIDVVELTDEYFLARGEFGSAYTPQVAGVELHRTVAGTKDWMLVFDEMSANDAHALTWICHTEAPFKQVGESYVATMSRASLAVTPLSPRALTPTMQPAMVEFGSGPQNPQPVQTGYELLLTMPEPQSKAYIANLLTPLDPDEAPPTASLRFEHGSPIVLEIRFADGTQQQAAIVPDAPKGTPKVILK
ncbi:DUF4962 domain-containing protein [Cerasicoccus fimbriatus]|uniref:DUF4962 domain-containing protein n=1 Tax=Cerasicoccus fimbriatus TaxID=3014554 RepID=UPI0022B3DEF1|nr:DUF4962 domain-containing protein [Cerasicoccus sp. TK19100]